MTLSSRDTSVRTNSPPLQGRGKGWGLPVQRLDTLHDRARAMRNQPTAPENRLWQILRGSRLEGYKFRRQAVIESTIADFLCPRKGLVIEVDGETHADAATDDRRTARLEARGFKVVRVSNRDVMENLGGVRQLILGVLRGLPDRHGPHPNPSPEGEGLSGRLDCGMDI